MRLKIAYVLPGTSLSGGVKVVLEHVLWLNRLPFVKAVAIAPGPYPNWFGNPCVPLITEDPLKADLSDFDVIVTTFYDQLPIYEKWDHKRIIHFCQGYEADYLESIERTELRRHIEAFYARPKVILTINKYIRDKIAERAMVFIVGQGLDRKVFNAPNNLTVQRERLLVVGPYDVPFKGIQRSLRLAKRIKTLRPTARLIRVAPFDTRHMEEECLLADEYHCGVSPSRMAELYRSSTLSICLPDKEGFGLPLLESLACGTPVIASDIPPFREICGPRYPLFRITDMGSMFEHALRLMDEPSYRNSMAALGVKAAKRFSYPKLILKLMSILLWVRMQPPNRF